MICQHDGMADTTTSLLRVGGLVAVLVLTTVGCGKSPTEIGVEKIIESQTGGDVDLDFDDDGGYSIKTEDGSMTIDEDGNFEVVDKDGEVITGSGDSDGNMTFEGDDGSFTMSQGSDIPDEWPSDVPIPDGFAVSSSSVMGDGADGTAITLGGTTDDGEAFASGYAAALAAAGFESDSEYSTDDMYTASYTNDAWAVTFGVTDYDSDHQVSVTLFSQ